MQLERRREDERVDSSAQPDLPSTSSSALGPAPQPPPDFAEYLRQMDARQGQQQQQHVQDRRQPPPPPTRTRQASHQSVASADAVSAASPQDATAAKDLLSSLQTAEVTLVEALHSVIRRQFEASITTAFVDTTPDAASSHPETDQQSATAPLVTLLQDMRRACDAVSSLPDTRDGSSTSQGPTMAQKRGSGRCYEDSTAGVMQEIRDKVEDLAPFFASEHGGAQLSVSASVARHIAAMLGCIARLQTLYAADPILAVQASATINTPLPTPGPYSSNQLHAPADSDFFATALSSASPADATGDLASQTETKPSEEAVYQTLHRQARALQSARLVRTLSSDSINAVRAVEEAELELLWGRVDDLLRDLSELCGRRNTIAYPAEVSPAAPASQQHRPLRQAVDHILVGPTPAMASDDPTFPSNQHALPEYSSLDPPEYVSPDDSREYAAVEDVKTEADRLTAGSRQRMSEHSHNGVLEDEKMQIDLDKMASAIERLYVASPQLADQRVDAVRTSTPHSGTTMADRAQTRELQLARLGAAIERLSRGRMEDQRAALSANFGTNNVHPPASVTVKGKAKENKLQSLNKLLDDIDRAANRSLNDQRVTMSPHQRAVLNGARRTAQLTAKDLRDLHHDEEAFREHLMESSGKGRLTSQDAEFPAHYQQFRNHQHASAPPEITTFPDATAAMKRRSFAHLFDSPMSSNRPASARARSSSVGALTPPVPSIPAAFTSEASSSTPQLTIGSAAPNQTIKKRFSVSKFLTKGSKEANSSAQGSTEQGSKRHSRAFTSNSRPSSAHYHELPLQLTYVTEEMRNLSSMIVRAWDARFEGTSPDPRNSNTLSSPASTTAALAQEAWSVTQSSKTSLELRTSTTSDKHDHHTILLAAETSPTTTKPLDMVFKGDHYEVRIATAESTNSTRTRDDLEIRSPYTAADLKAHARTTDAFMCVSCGVPLIKLANITRYNDLPSEHWAELLDAWMCHQDQSLSEELIAKGNNIWPKDHQALLSSTGIIVSSPNASSWTIASELEPTEGADATWHPVRCQSCYALVGRCSGGPIPLGEGEDPSKVYIRFSKIAIQPSPASTMPTYSMASQITSQLLETSLARAIHRFVVQDEEQGLPRLLLWVFNPYVRILSNSPYFTSDVPISAAKILYRTLADLESDGETGIPHLLGNSESDALILPRSACLHLAKTLADSTEVYPKSQRKLGEWTVGWLERAQ